MKKMFICLLFVLCLFITGCGSNEEKVVATFNDFTTVLNENNFTVSDNTEEYTKKVDYILGARLAFFDENLQLEMIEYKDLETAKKVQDGQIKNFALRKSSGAFEDVDKGKNYYMYTLISNDRYMISLRVENTLIFSQTLLANKETVEKVLNELGY